MSATPALNFETGIAGLPERQASLWGFRSGGRGTHTSRTIMPDELSQLLDAVPGEARRQDYVDAVTHDNCLGKTALAGNEQLLAILDRHDVLAANVDDWTAAGTLAVERLPAFQRLEALLRHAESLEVAKQVEPQIAAIVAGRRLLDASDPVPRLAAKLTDALRTALVTSDERHAATYDDERQRLEAFDGWQRIEHEVRGEILSRLRIAKASTGATGTQEEVLESLGRISLDAWRTRTAALPQLFAQAKVEAHRLIEPEIRHLKLGSATLRTPEEVRDWIEKTERELLEQIGQGPIAIG